MQIKVVEIKYILLWYIIWKKESNKRIEKVKERERERENERKSFLSFLGMLLHGGGKKPFIGFIMAINVVIHYFSFTTIF